jgi:hypothetical protein
LIIGKQYRVNMVAQKICLFADRVCAGFRAQENFCADGKIAIFNGVSERSQGVRTAGNSWLGISR